MTIFTEVPAEIGYAAATARTLASGNVALLAGDERKVLAIVTGAAWDAWCGDPDQVPFDEGRCCSICDGLGHGYPGGGPCPLEERGWEDAEQDRQREAAGWL